MTALTGVFLDHKEYLYSEKILLFRLSKVLAFSQCWWHNDDIVYLVEQCKLIVCLVQVNIQLTIL